MKVVGIIGGICSGKTAVASIFHQLGIPVIDADCIGYQVMEFSQVTAAARFRWGEPVFLPSGKIDRKKVASIVFGKPAELTFWNNLMHPLIGGEVNKRIRKHQADGTEICLLDAPLLLESGWDILTEKIIFVDTPLEVRLRRTAERGWTGNELQRREAVQLPVQAKKQRADYVINNAGTLDETREQVCRILSALSEPQR
ncbi:MAG: dephospho-CoA kinase [Planctomycetaceae bacterium]|jgi:dephospho-CoA kinase|nr:dephospho-CoA kinase [Planctomycetaceae bacterium]